MLDIHHIFLLTLHHRIFSVFECSTHDEFVLLFGPSILEWLVFPEGRGEGVEKLLAGGGPREQVLPGATELRGSGPWFDEARWVTLTRVES